MSVEFIPLIFFALAQIGTPGPANMAYWRLELAMVLDVLCHL